MHTISNEFITVDISEKGAELQSIFHKQLQLEYMWSAGPEWPKKSPVLFPIIGELKNNEYTYKGKKYQLSRHGFARDMTFTVSHQEEDAITFRIQSTEETKKVYPFDFSFSVSYHLQSTSLAVTYKVDNAGENDMYFSVGGHPAFKVPLVANTFFEDYKLVFNERETTGRWPLTKDGLVKNESLLFLNNDTTVALDKKLFATDAVVFKHLQSTSVKLISSKTEHGITMDFSGFPFLGIWETKGGDFVCIEPWCGIADNETATGNIEEKEGINHLAPGDTFSRTFTLHFY